MESMYHISKQCVSNNIKTILILFKLLVYLEFTQFIWFKSSYIIFLSFKIRLEFKILFNKNKCIILNQYFYWYTIPPYIKFIFQLMMEYHNQWKKKKTKSTTIFLGDCYSDQWLKRIWIEVSVFFISASFSCAFNSLFILNQINIYVFPHACLVLSFSILVCSTDR